MKLERMFAVAAALAGPDGLKFRADGLGAVGQQAGETQVAKGVEVGELLRGEGGRHGCPWDSG